MDMEPYLRAFGQLRVDKNTKRWGPATTYRAPHKPFLLLSILDLFARGSISNNLIEINPELGTIFAEYWAKVFSPEHRGNIALPFFHLSSSTFWHLVPRPGCEEELNRLGQIDTLNHLNRLVLGARLDDELYHLLQLEDTRNALRAILIQEYFISELHSVLLAQGVVNLASFQYSQTLIEQSKKKIRETTSEYGQVQPIVRDQGFRRAIVQIYNHRCAFCGVRMMTPDGHSVVEAAHIVPWSVSHNDDPHNGIALCRLCHWTFDQGLTSISTRCLVVLSGELRSSLNVAGHLLTLENRAILGPEDQELWPDHDALKWHRLKVFRGN